MCAVLPRAAFISTARIDLIRMNFIRYVLTTAVMLLQTAFMVGWIAVLYSGYFWIQAPLLISVYTLELLGLFLDTGTAT